MKNIIRLITGSVLMLFVAACSTDTTKDVFDPSAIDPSAAFFKQNALSREFPMESEDQTIEITLTRQNAKGEVTIGLNYTVVDTALDFIEIPNSVTFKDGEYETTANVTIKDIANFTKGVTYSAAISVGDHHEFEEVTFEEEKAQLPRHIKTRATATGYTTITLSFAMELIWKPWYILKDFGEILKINEYSEATKDHFKTDASGKPIAQTAIWYDWGFEENAEAVVQRAEGTNVFRLYNYQLPGERAVNVIWSVDGDEENMLTVGGNKYYRASLTAQSTGAAYDDSNEFWVQDIADMQGSPLYYPNYPCFWDGGRYFYFTLYWHVPGLGGWASYNSISDVFEFQTGEPAPEVEIEYNGATKTESGFAYGTVTFTPNNDVTKYYATVINGAFSGNEELFDELVDTFIAAAKAGKTSFTRGSGWTAQTYPIVALTEADTREWKFESGNYTALAYSYYQKDKESKPVEGFDYAEFYADTDFDSEWGNTAYCDADNFYVDYFGGPGYGYLPSNSICIYVEPLDEDGLDPVTAVRFAAVLKDVYDSASYAGNEAYLAENGTSWSSTDLGYVNNDGYNYDWIGGLKPDTEYVVLIEASTKNGSKIYEIEAATDPVGAYSKLSLATATMDDTSGNDSYFAHTNVLGQFSVNYESDYGVVQGGYYASVKADTVKSAVLAANKVWGEVFAIDKDNNLKLQSGKTDADVIALLASNGTRFSSNSNSSDLAAFNAKGKGKGARIKVSAAVAPGTDMLILGYVEYADGKTSWAAAINTTDDAPVAAFEQTAEIVNGKVQFNWIAEPEFEKQEVKSVVYHLATADELQAAGVDTSKLADADLNGTEANATNVEALKELLSAQGKTFTGDQAYYKINSAAGYTAEFNAPVTGTHYLVAYATTADQYVTKLTVTAL